MPTLTVIAGPNGSGKSTFAALYQLLTIDPDRITASYGQGFTAATNLQGARAALAQMHEHLNARRTFAIETTLAGGQPLRLMAQAKAAGYQVNLAFIVPNEAEDTRLRIDNRVIQGGHNIASADLERREGRILEHLPTALKRADTTAFYVSSVSTQDFALAGAAYGRTLQLTPHLPAVIVQVLTKQFEVEQVSAVSNSATIHQLFSTRNLL